MNTLEKLDKVDLQILRTLQSNARLTTKELAASVSLSSTPVFERLKRLENGGYIKKYIAVLDAEKLNQGFVVFCSVKLRRLNKEIAAEFTRIIQENSASHRMLQYIGKLRLPAEDPCTEYEVLPGVYLERVRHDRQPRIARKHLCDGRGKA